MLWLCRSFKDELRAIAHKSIVDYAELSKQNNNV